MKVCAARVFFFFDESKIAPQAKKNFDLFPTVSDHFPTRYVRSPPPRKRTRHFSEVFLVTRRIHVALPLDMGAIILHALDQLICWHLARVLLQHRRNVVERAVLIHVAHGHETVTVIGALTLKFIGEGHGTRNAREAAYQFVIASQHV